MPAAPDRTYLNDALQPAMDPEGAEAVAIRIQPSLTNLPPGAPLAEGTATANAVHTLAANTASAGTFRLVFRGYQTSILNFNDSAATVAAALNALPSVPTGSVVGSGTAVNGAGLVLTWSGTFMAGVPVELPVILIVTAFATAQPTIVSTTVGATVGYYGPYISGGSNGLGVAKLLNKYRLSTDGAGNITFGALAVGEEFGQTKLTAPVYMSGTFRIEDCPIVAQPGLTGGFLDAAMFTSQTPPFGRILQGSVALGSGLFRVG